jgi:hypothetical protein
MERELELTVRYAHADMTGDAASITVVTDHGRLTLRMHRIVLGNLAGTIARALWPREERPELADVASSEDIPVQHDAQEPEAEHLGPSAGDADDIPTQPEPREPAQGVLAAFDTVWPKVSEPTAGVAPDDVPNQPESAAPEAAVADAAPHDDIPSQPALGEPDRDVVPSVADAAPRDEPAGRARPPRRKAFRLAPRRKKR